MNKSDIIRLIDALAASGDLLEAINAMDEYNNGMDSSLNNSIIMLKARYNSTEKSARNGLLSTSDYNLQIAKVRHSMLQLKDDLPAQGNTVSQKFPTNDTTNTGGGADDSTSGIRKILFLAANPDDSIRLHLAREERKIKDMLSTTSNRDAFKFESELAARLSTITGALQSQKPEIVHFSGHGEGEGGIVIEDSTGNSKLLSTARLDFLFETVKDNIQCVILSACYSKDQAKVISKHNIHVIGMNKTIDDDAAIGFAEGFYQGLGEGADYKRAFKMGLIFIDDESDVHIPELWLNGECIAQR